MVGPAISQYWLTYDDHELEIHIAIWWAPAARAGQSPARSVQPGQLTWRVYDFLRWCVEHCGRIQAMRDEEAKATTPAAAV